MSSVMWRAMGAAWSSPVGCPAARESLPDFLPDLPPGGGLERVAVFGPEQPTVGGGAEGLDVRAEEFDELGRDRDLPYGSAGSRAGPAFGAAFEAAVQTVRLAGSGSCLAACLRTAAPASPKRPRGQLPSGYLQTWEEFRPTRREGVASHARTRLLALDL